MLKRLKNFSKIRSYGDWPKVKPGELLIVPSDNRLIDQPPYLNSEGWPDWWQNLPKDAPGTILSCKGIQDYLSLGITVPLWCDVEFFPVGMKEMSARTSDENFRIERFSYSMAQGAPINEGRDRSESSYPKIVNPYLFKTAPGYSMLALPMAYEPDPRYQVLPAIIHTDFYHNLHVVVRVMSEESFVIKGGTPIYQLIPFCRKDQVGKILLGDAAMHDLGVQRGVSRNGIGVFSRKGLYRKHEREADAGECPMG